MVTSQADLKATLRASVFFTTTQRLLMDAKTNRNVTALMKGADAVDSAGFDLLPDEAQEDLLALYASAMVACGMCQP